MFQSTMTDPAISCKSIVNGVGTELSASGVKVKFVSRTIARVGQLVSETIMQHYTKDKFAFAQ
jgi:hypothetical protein